MRVSLRLLLLICAGLCQPLTLWPQSRVTPEETKAFADNIMCGPNCLWQIAYLYGKEYQLGGLRSLAGTKPYKGASVAGMLQALSSMKIPARAVRLDIGQLKAIDGVVVLFSTAVR